MSVYDNIRIDINELQDEIEETLSRRLTPSPRLLKQYCDRLTSVYGIDGDGSIMSHYHWSLYYYCIEDWKHAAYHKSREVELVEYLIQTFGPVKSVIPKYSVDQKYLGRTLSSLRNLHVKLGNNQEVDLISERIKLHENKS